MTARRNQFLIGFFAKMCYHLHRITVSYERKRRNLPCQRNIHTNTRIPMRMGIRTTMKIPGPF